MENINQDIQNTLIKFLKKGDKIILGVSGGPDSIFLLNECLKYEKTHSLKIIVAHVNHKLRNKESDKEEKFVEKIAKNNNLKYELLILENLPKGNLEEQCRIQRYNFFEKLRKKYKAKWILTAHHLNDNIETVILNLIRGGFIDGLSGMDLCDKKRHLFRPLLFTTKEHILEDLKKHKIPFRLDKSNMDPRFSRNLVRLMVIPRLKTINKNLEQVFYHNISNFRELKTYIDKKTDNWLKSHYKKDNKFSHKNFLQLEPIMQKSVLSNIYKRKYGNLNKFNQNHLNQILKIIHQNDSNKKKEFGDDYFIQIKRSKDDNKKYIALISV